MTSTTQEFETWFAKLTAFAQRLSDEEKGGEEREVKEVAKQLLETLKREKLVLDWKKRQATRAAVRYAIETMLDELPRVYTPELYERKCEVVYQHVFESYYGQEKSLYAAN